MPLVLLLHPGAFDAQVMDRLLDVHTQSGFRFVSLAEAEKDPFYASAPNPALPGHSPTRDAAAIKGGLTVPGSAIRTPGPDVCAPGL